MGLIVGRNFKRGEGDNKEEAHNLTLDNIVHLQTDIFISN